MPPVPHQETAAVEEVRCPSCRRRATAHVERELRGTLRTVTFTCDACSYAWRPTAATLKRIEARRQRARETRQR